MPLKLNASVGKLGCANNQVDVRAVQETLIERADGDIGVTVNGQCDAATIAAIVAYQKQVLKLPFPDGKIAVGGTTHTFLNDPRKRFRGAAKPGAPVVPGKPGGGPAPGGGAPAGGANSPAVLTRTGFWEAWATEVLSPSERNQIGDAYQRDIEPFAKGIPGFYGRLEDGRRLGKLAYWLWQNKMLRQVPSVARVMGKLPNEYFDAVLDSFGKTGRAGKVVNMMASGAEKVGLITLFVDIVIHGYNGNWGAAIGECYKMVMNKAVPWAGMIEGLQSLMDALPMDEAKKTLLFKVLRFVDPVGLGGAAPDALFSLGKFIMTKDESQAYRILDEAASRLEKGPTGLLKVPAEYIADFVFKVVNSKPRTDYGEWVERSHRAGRGPKF